MGFGGYATFPLTFGDTSGDAFETEHKALLETMSPALDPTEDTAHEIETYAEALALAMVWDANERLANQAIPERMLEALTDWEQILKLAPSVDDSDQERRARVAAKLRGLINNALPDIEATAKKVLGVNFAAVVLVDPANHVTYWDGGVPGPPGLEWYSSRAIVGVRMTQTGLTSAQFAAKRAALTQALESTIPAWMVAACGVGSEFVVNQGVVGLTLI
jgi:hypothetical protein